MLNQNFEFVICILIVIYVVYEYKVNKIQLTPLNRVTLVPGQFVPINRRTQLCGVDFILKFQNDRRDLLSTTKYTQGVFR